MDPLANVTVPGQDPVPVLGQDPVLVPGPEPGSGPVPGQDPDPVGQDPIAVVGQFLLNRARSWSQTWTGSQSLSWVTYSGPSQTRSQSQSQARPVMVRPCTGPHRSYGSL